MSDLGLTGENPQVRPAGLTGQRSHSVAREPSVNERLDSHEQGLEKTRVRPQLSLRQRNEQIAMMAIQERRGRKPAGRSSGVRVRFSPRAPVV